MIHIDRPPITPEIRAALEKRYSKKDNKTELELAREYYGAIPPPVKAYPFERYKEEEVCRALDDLFHGKCAYCETSYRAADTQDVEHFRPKGAVTEAPNHPGYWWKAAAWDNLLPSCPACNQRRRHVMFKPGMTLEELETASRKRAEDLSGKANAFPLSGNNWITQEGGDETTEDPLLIDPCRREPDQHLEFVFDVPANASIWEVEKLTAFLRPRQVGGAEDPYAKASISIYGLRRAGLVRAHIALLQNLQRQCASIASLVRVLAQEPPPAIESALLDWLRNRRDDLFALAEPKQPYSALVRAFLTRFEADLARLRDEAV